MSQLVVQHKPVPWGRVVTISSDSRPGQLSFFSLYHAERNSSLPCKAHLYPHLNSDKVIKDGERVDSNFSATDLVFQQTVAVPPFTTHTYSVVAGGERVRNERYEIYGVFSTDQPPPSAPVDQAAVAHGSPVGGADYIASVRAGDVGGVARVQALFYSEKGGNHPKATLTLHLNGARIFNESQGNFSTSNIPWDASFEACPGSTFTFTARGEGFDTRNERVDLTVTYTPTGS